MAEREACLGRRCTWRPFWQTRGLRMGTTVFAQYLLMPKKEFHSLGRQNVEAVTLISVSCQGPGAVTFPGNNQPSGVRWVLRHRPRALSALLACASGLVSPVPAHMAADFNS